MVCIGVDSAVSIIIIVACLDEASKLGVRAGEGENITDTVIVDVIAEPMEELRG